MKPNLRIIPAGVVAGVLLSACGSSQPSADSGGLGTYSSTLKNGAVVSTDLWDDTSKPGLTQDAERFLATITDGADSGLSYASVRVDNTKGTDAASVTGVKVTLHTGESVTLVPVWKKITDDCKLVPSSDWDATQQDKDLYNSGCVALYNRDVNDHNPAPEGKTITETFVSEHKLTGTPKSVSFVLGGTPNAESKASNK